MEHKKVFFLVPKGATIPADFTLPVMEEALDPFGRISAAIEHPADFVMVPMEPEFLQTLVQGQKFLGGRIALILDWPDIETPLAWYQFATIFPTANGDEVVARYTRTEKEPTATVTADAVSDRANRTSAQPKREPNVLGESEEESEEE